MVYIILSHFISFCHHCYFTLYPISQHTKRCQKVDRPDGSVTLLSLVGFRSSITASRSNLPFLGFSEFIRCVLSCFMEGLGYLWDMHGISLETEAFLAPFRPFAPFRPRRYDRPRAGPPAIRWSPRPRHPPRPATASGSAPP